MEFTRIQSPYTAQDSTRSGDGDAEGRGLHAARLGGVGPTVLVAEDDDSIRELMHLLLGMRGYRVVETRDGQETVDVAKDVRPDIILMDLQLPRLNGFAVTRFLRQTDALRHVPIIVVSAHDPAKHRNLALAAGCNAYVQKPIDFDQLDELMVSLIPK